MRGRLGSFSREREKRWGIGMAFRLESGRIRLFAPILFPIATRQKLPWGTRKWCSEASEHPTCVLSFTLFMAAELLRACGPRMYKSLSHPTFRCLFPFRVCPSAHT